MINIGFIKGGAAGSARVDCNLSRAQLEQYLRAAGARDAAASQLGDGDRMAAYYAGHAANGPGRWLGRGADALGITGQAANPEEFRPGY